MLRIPLPEYADGPLKLCRSTASVGNASKCARAEGYGNTLALTNPLPEDDGFALALPEKPRRG